MYIYTYIYIYIYTQECLVAFGMGFHSRLGANSMVLHLSEDLIRQIGELVVGGMRWEATPLRWPHTDFFVFLFCVARCLVFLVGYLVAEMYACVCLPRCVCVCMCVHVCVCVCVCVWKYVCESMSHEASFRIARVCMYVNSWNNISLARSVCVYVRTQYACACMHLEVMCTHRHHIFACMHAYVLWPI